MRKNVWLIFLLLLLLSACNSDVFVKEFLPKEMSYTLESGDSIRIPFGDDAWEIEGVYLTGELTGDVYDLEGNLQEKNVPLHGKYIQGLVRMVSENEFFGIQLERSSGKELKVKAGINLNDHDVEITVWILHEAARVPIYLTFRPTRSKYEVNQIEYHWDCFQVGKETEQIVWSTTYSNGGSSPLKGIVKPYENVHRHAMIQLEEENYWLETLFGTPLPDVEIYDVIGGKPKLNGARLPMDGNLHAIIDPALEQIIDTVTIAPRTKQTVSVWIYRQEFILPITVHVCNKQMDRVLDLEGKISNSQPTRYKIVKEKPEEIKG